MSTDYAIAPMRLDERDALHELLRGARLPLDGLDEDVDVLLAHRDDQVVGSVALEVYDDGALLRSLAVAESERGHGLGVTLTRAIIAYARDRGVTDVFLLTETAERFFPRFGFRRIKRADVPAGVQQSVEFTTVCPASAAVQTLSL